MKTLLSLLAIAVVCLAVLGAWTAVEWCRSVEHQCEVLMERVSEAEVSGRALQMRVDQLVSQQMIERDATPPIAGTTTRSQLAAGQ